MSDAIVYVSEEEFPTLSIMDATSPTKTAYLNEQSFPQGVHYQGDTTLVSPADTATKAQILKLKMQMTSEIQDSDEQYVGSESSIAKVPIV